MTNHNTISKNAVGGAPSFRPKFMLYHANAKGTGSALKMSLHPAHDDKSGSIWLTIASQMTIGNREGASPVYPRFDWENAICVKLDFNDLCQILQVLRGAAESVASGKGLFHSSSRCVTRILFRHLIEPTAGYSFEIYRTPRDGGEETRAHFFVTAVEAEGITDAIAGVMGVVVFGIPMVIPHDTSEYEEQERKFRYAKANQSN